MQLTLTDFQNAKVPLTKVEVPELSGHVFMRPLLVKELNELQKRFGDSQNVDVANMDFLFALLAHVIVDEAGVKVFGDESQVKVLLEQGVNLLIRLAQSAVNVSGIDAKKN